MKIIFVDSYNLLWNGITARFETGISGSHNGHLYLAEGLSRLENNEVEIVSTKNNIIENTYLGVKYTNIINFKETECDYIIIMNNLNSLSILDKIKSYNKIIILTQNDLNGNFDRFFKIDKTKIIIAYISEFAKTNILLVQSFLKEYENILLYNSIDLNDISNIKLDINSKENFLCYFACIERGYKMVIEILNQLDNYKLFIQTYNNIETYNLPKNNNINTIENSSKYKVLENVSKSKYFVYPLINLDNNFIHYDTFGYVVLEALLLGTIVIAPKIKVYEELYGDAICYIDTDDIIPQDDLLYWKKINSNFGYPILNRYVEKIKLLDSDVNLRNSYIEKGLALKYKFSNIKISTEFNDFLKKDNLTSFYKNLSTKKCIPDNHTNYLKNLKIQGFEPKVIYDIGSCCFHWLNEAKKFWPNATYILFDGNSKLDFLYKENCNYEYYIGVLSDIDDNIVKFYYNDYFPGGNSYYREIGCENGKYYPENMYLEEKTKKLDTIVKERNFPLPDFVKIDVQGSEIDIIKGGINTIKNASRLIVELQHTEYNLGAQTSNITQPLIENILNFKCTAPLFQNNGPDGDYGFINPSKIEKKILTIFAGRELNIKILKKYLQKAFDLNIIDEVHFWNNTRNAEDESYIKTISNLKRTSSTNYNYILITPIIINNSFELNVKASNDIHIKITNNDTEYEIVLGGWNNTISVIRENNHEICNLVRSNVADGLIKNKFNITIDNNILYILKNDELLFSQKIIDNFEINKIYFKTGHNCIGDLSYETTQNKGFYFMDTCEKSWKNYYNYYNDTTFENDIILKCDDDIVFMDLNKLPKYIEFVKNNDYDLVFANTINNGVSAYFQQNKFNLIPKELMDLEYPHKGFCGSLWENGKKAENLHKYFIENYKTFLNYDYNDEIIDIKTRFSINFFAFKGKNWDKIKDCYGDDEYILTVDYVKNRNFKNILYTDFYVSHLSFYKQNETGINLNLLLDNYHKLYDTLQEEK